MKYLYADSEPFPLEYDFLATLKAFMHAAAKTYGLLARNEALETEIVARNQRTQEILGSIAEFTGAMEAARSAASDHFTAVPEVVAYSREIEEYLGRSGTATREQCARNNDDKNQAALAEIEAHRKEMRTLVEEFVLGAQLGMDLAFCKLALKDERYEVKVGGWTQGPIEADYGVSIDRLPEWKEPRRVETLIGNLILQVGMKKKFLSKNMTRELIDVSDYTLGDAHVHPNGAEIQLRRKPQTTKEVAVVALMRVEGGSLRGTISRPEHENGAPFPMASDDVPKIEKLWQTIDKAARAALPKRNSISAVRLDGQDVFAQDLAPRLFDRLIDRFTPFVTEIAKRSPSANELSLKLERDDGRREEIYQRKSELAEELKELEPRMRSRFAPLGFG